MLREAVLSTCDEQWLVRGWARFLSSEAGARHRDAANTFEPGFFEEKKLRPRFSAGCGMQIWKMEGDVPRHVPSITEPELSSA